MGKTVIVYYSQHHGNTKKVLDAIAGYDNDVMLIDVTEKHEVDLTGYDRIGFASGIYFGKFAEQLHIFASANIWSRWPLFGAAIMMVYGFIALAVAAVGTVVVVIKVRKACSHGKEDWACLLVTFKNAGGNINLDEALEKLFHEGLRMPGAMCGLWGVCGAVTSVGAALSIIDGTGPLSVDGTWGNHMQFTSAVLSELGKINGPRCCKRDAMIAFKNGIEYVNVHYDVKLEYEDQECRYCKQFG